MEQMNFHLVTKHIFMDTVLNEACDIQIWREKKGKTADTRKYENDKNCAGCEMK